MGPRAPHAPGRCAYFSHVRALALCNLPALLPPACAPPWGVNCSGNVIASAMSLPVRGWRRCADLYSLPPTLPSLMSARETDSGNSTPRSLMAGVVGGTASATSSPRRYASMEALPQRGRRSEDGRRPAPRASEPGAPFNPKPGDKPLAPPHHGRRSEGGRRCVPRASDPGVHPRVGSLGCDTQALPPCGRCDEDNRRPGLRASDRGAHPSG